MRLFRKKMKKPFVALIYVGCKDMILCGTRNQEFTVSSGSAIRISFPCGVEEIGAGLQTIMGETPKLNKENPNPNLLEEVTGLKNLRGFSRAYPLLITVSWPVEEKICFQRYERTEDGGHAPTKNRKCCPLSANGLELGTCVYEMMEAASQAAETGTSTAERK